MTTRCKPGDLAIILQDESQCVANVGRVVEVGGPPAINRLGQLTWLIKPVTPEPYWIYNFPDDSICPMTPADDDIEHPDDWMQPIRPSHDINAADRREVAEEQRLEEEMLS